MGALGRRAALGAAVAVQLASAACGKASANDAGTGGGTSGSGDGGCTATEPGPSLGERCGASGWCWDNPLPQGNDLSSVFGASSTDVWAAGGAGVLLHWDGGSWSVVESGTLDPLSGVFVADGGTAWAIGHGHPLDGGSIAEIFSWDGQHWTLVNDSTTRGLTDTTLAALYGTSPSDLWAVGTRDPGPPQGLSGVVLHWNGSFWLQDPGPTTYGLELEGVWSDPEWANVWVSGASVLGNYSGVLLHRTLQDAGFTSPLVPVWEAVAIDAPDLHRVWGSASYDVTAVGGDPVAATGAVVHWDGRSWRSLVVEGGFVPPELFGVSGSGFGETWAAGVEGPLCQREGEVLASVPVGAASSDHQDWLAGDADGGRASTGSRLSPIGANIWSAAHDDAWVAGGAGALFHWDGTSWHRALPLGPTTQPLRGAFARAPDDVWFAGDDGIVLHFDGAATAAYATGTAGSLDALSGDDRGELWAVGASGLALHHVPASACGWTGVATGSQADLRGVFVASQTDAWAVGRAGTLLHWDGARWDPRISGTVADLNAVNGPIGIDAGPTQVWAVGSGVQLHWDGSAWSRPTPQLEADLVGLWTSPDLDTWAVGSGLDTNGSPVQIWHFGGSSGWAPSGGDHGIVARAIWGSGSQDLFVAGWGGALLHYDGVAWTKLATATVQDIEAIAGAGTSDLWLAGSGGMLIHQRR